MNMPNNRRKPERQSHGFTLIELLVVISIIMLLIGILVPGIRGVTRHAKGLKQKSEFKNMETGLELFREYFEDYPESTAIGTDGIAAEDGGSAPYVCGAQQLAEALLGRDLKGFDYMTRWHPEFEQTLPGGIDLEIYASTAKGSTDLQKQDSMDRRKGPFVEVADTIALQVGQFYDDAKSVYTPDDTAPYAYPAPVISDVFVRKKITLATGERIQIGTPVLYYRADPQAIRKAQNHDNGWNGSDVYQDWIYNYDDNRYILELGQLRNPTQPHPWYDSADMTKSISLFYEDITNPTVDQFDAPFNPNTFLLISAGWDGEFGTKDDITNFNY